MKSSTKWAIPALGALALVTCVAAAEGLAAHPRAMGLGNGEGPWHGRGGGPGLVAHLTQALGLSEDQAGQVKAIVSKYMDGALGQVMHAMREAHGELHAVVVDPAATDDLVGAKAGAVSALVSQAAIEHHHMAIEISAVLTPEQRQKAVQLLQNMRDRRWGPPSPGEAPGGF